jgi:PAS domain S-box-containing protein
MKYSLSALQPFEATGAALFYDGEVHTVGEVPSTPELRALADWVGGRTVDSLFECASVARANPSLRSLTPTASGVFAFQLSPLRPDYLMWFRKERLRTVKWAGDPAKPMIDNDPLHLSPRRSFATWSEIVRGTASPWSHAEEALGRAIGNALVDIILQINAVRLVFAQHQLSQVRTAVENSLEAVIIANAQGQVLFANGAFRRLTQETDTGIANLEEIAAKFQESLTVRQLLRRLLADGVPCRGEWTLASALRPTVSVSVRADVIPAQHGGALGFILIFTDISDRKHAEDARRRFHAAMSSGAAMAASGEQHSDPFGEPDVVVSSIVSNANVAAMEIADIGDQPQVEPLLEELQGSARRAALIYRQLRDVAKTR